MGHIRLFQITSRTQAGSRIMSPGGSGRSRYLVAGMPRRTQHRRNIDTYHARVGGEAGVYVKARKFEIGRRKLKDWCVFFSGREG